MTIHAEHPTGGPLCQTPPRIITPVTNDRSMVTCQDCLEWLHS